MQVPDNSINHLRLDCDFFSPDKTLLDLSPEINPLHAPNPLDKFNLTNNQYA